MQFIFETARLRVRKLMLSDFESFHKMQNNINVMKYVRGAAMTFNENKEELPKLIAFYEKPDNDFWIFAVERTLDSIFVGTVALVKDTNHGDNHDKNKLTALNIKKDKCEIGYRFLETYWGNGYGYEIAKGLINYCQEVGFTQLIANVATENNASLKIIESLNFDFIEDFVSDDLKLPERKYILKL